MTWQLALSALVDYGALVVLGGVAGGGVAAYIVSGVYLALRAGYERGIIAAVASCLEVKLAGARSPRGDCGAS